MRAAVSGPPKLADENNLNNGFAILDTSEVQARKPDAQMDFDFAKVVETSKDNPVFYVQYAHARICSILRKAVAEGFAPAADHLDRLTAEDLALVKQAAQSLAVRGQLVILGLGAEEFPVDAIDIMQNGKVIRGSVEGDSDPLEMVPRLLRLSAEGKFDVDGLVTPYPFTQINSAIDDVVAGRVVKPVLVW